MSEIQLVTVAKDGETLEVHPSTVESHEKQGWSIVPDEKPESGEAGKARKKGK